MECWQNDGQELLVSSPFAQGAPHLRVQLPRLSDFSWCCESRRRGWISSLAERFIIEALIRLRLKHRRPQSFKLHCVCRSCCKCGWSASPGDPISTSGNPGILGARSWVWLFCRSRRWLRGCRTTTLLIELCPHPYFKFSNIDLFSL